LIPRQSKGVGGNDMDLDFRGKRGQRFQECRLVIF
jgi:hypothetical protein